MRHSSWMAMLSLGGSHDGDHEKSSYAKAARSSGLSSAYSHSRVPSLRTQLFTSKLRYETNINGGSGDRSASFPSTRFIRRTVILLACSTVLLVFIFLQDEDASQSIAGTSIPTAIHKLASRLPARKHKALHQTLAAQKHEDATRLRARKARGDTATVSEEDMARRRPFAIKPLTLMDPNYEIIITQSSLQHQNTTWRHANRDSSSPWLIQTVGYLRVTNGIRPEPDRMTAWCKLPPASDKIISSAPVKATIKMQNVPPRDRRIGQDVFMWIECDATPLIDAATTNDTMRADDETGAEPTEEVARSLRHIQIGFAFEHDFGTAETTYSGVRRLNFWYGAQDIDVYLTKPVSKAQQTVCLTPAFYKPGQMPVAKWVEWREHMRQLGTDRVAWYGRSSSMRTFVETYTSLTGVKDTFRHAPPLGSVENDFDRPYHDQDAWYNDCFLANRLSSEYITVIDIDEFPMVDYEDTTRTPQQQWTDFLTSMPDEMGSWELPRIRMAGHVDSQLKSVKGTSQLVQEQHSCVRQYETQVKSFYRARSVRTVNQHTKTDMYPLGEDRARHMGKNHDQKYRSLRRDASQWPKLVHFRAPNGKVKSNCADASPLQDSAVYADYLVSLNAEVKRLTTEIERRVRIRGMHAG